MSGIRKEQMRELASTPILALPKNGIMGALREKAVQAIEDGNFGQAMAVALLVISCPDIDTPRDVTDLMFRGQKIVWHGGPSIDRRVAL